MAWTTDAMDHVIRSEIWSRQLKEVLEDDLQAQKYVDWLDEFPDGNQFTIPSVGQATVRDYVEDSSVVYDKMDTGEFTFTIAEYISSATYITDKAKQDSFYMSQLISKFVPSQRRAINEHVETTIFDRANTGQTVSNTNTINGAYHRFVANKGGSDDKLQLNDYAKAKHALTVANVPLTNLVAVVDPSAAFYAETVTNIVNVSNNPRWEGIIESGITTGMRFVRNIYGFDVYESNYLSDAGQDGTGGETVDSDTVANGKACLFFSAAPDVLPIVGAWRQEPRVESERNKDKQRDEYVTTARYDAKLYRPENMVIVLNDTSGVYS